MPPSMRYFFRAVFHFHKNLFEQDKNLKKDANGKVKKPSFLAVQQLCPYLLDKWLVPIISQDLVVYGLTRTYYLRNNALCNM